MLTSLRTLALALTVAATLGLAGLATAGDCYAPAYTWKTVTVFVPVEKAYTDHVTRYDHCGRPYVVEVEKVKIVKVPVTKRIKVWL